MKVVKSGERLEGACLGPEGAEPFERLLIRPAREGRAAVFQVLGEIRRGPATPARLPLRAMLVGK